jgi:hypothetical protein
MTQADASAARAARIARLQAAGGRKREAASARARRAIIALRARGAPINFNTVAREGRVSKDFLYRNADIRQQIERQRTPQRAGFSRRRGEGPSTASAAVQLEVVRTALQRLRLENLQLKADNAALRGELVRLGQLHL